MAEQLIHRGTLEGHSGWVTSLATSLEKSVFAAAAQIVAVVANPASIALTCCCPRRETSPSSSGT